SYRGPLPELSPEQTALRDELRGDVEALARKIGERNLRSAETYRKLVEAAEFIERSLLEAAYSWVGRQSYNVQRHGKSWKCDNLGVEGPGGGPADGTVVVGGHYDGVEGTPGANDNASGCAATLALARRFARRKCDRTLRFVAWVNEEPPYFQENTMGSVV